MGRKKTVLDDTTNYIGMKYCSWTIVDQYIVVYNSAKLLFKVQCSCGHTKNVNKHEFVRKYLSEKCYSCMNRDKI